MGFESFLAADGVPKLVHSGVLGWDGMGRGLYDPHLFRITTIYFIKIKKAEEERRKRNIIGSK
jgi:hypothetical protein